VARPPRSGPAADPTFVFPMKSTPKEWDEVRSAFATSIMVDTSINSLAQNLDGPEWPIKAKDESPAKYIDLTFDEAVELLQLKGQKPELLDQLIGILKETLAFDSPFGEMVEQAKEAAERDNPLLKNLAKLGISENFPITLTALEPGTLEFCKLEGRHTLGEFAVFAQSMAQNVIVGGDFKKLLNALSHVDEAALAEVLPFRRGQKGLHLIEALAHCSRSADGAARAEVAASWFRDDLNAIEQDLAAGGALERHFVVLGNPELERKAQALVRPLLRLPAGAAAAKPAEEKKKAGLFGWLFGRK
jgi:hypothetical protein